MVPGHYKPCAECNENGCLFKIQKNHGLTAKAQFWLSQVQTGNCSPAKRLEHDSKCAFFHSKADGEKFRSNCVGLKSINHAFRSYIKSKGKKNMRSG
jgi:hypothetical protein